MSAAGCHWLAALLAQYRSRYPEVMVDVFFEDRLVDLVDEGCDIALRICSSPADLPQGLIARSIRPVTFYLAASREYVRRHGAPQTPEELAQHDFVAVDNLNSLPLEGPSGKVEVPLRIAVRYRSMGTVANAIAAGIGIAAVPGMLFEEPPFKDVLTPILPECPLRNAKLYLVHVSRRFVPPKIHTFVDFIAESLSRIRLPKPLSTTVAYNRAVSDVAA